MAVEQRAGQIEHAGEHFARDFADRWQRAWNSRDPDQVVSLCTEDVSWDDPLTEQPERGRAAVAEYLRSVWRSFPDLEFTWPEGPYASFDGIKLALHWRVTGTMLGAMDPPGFAATGRRIETDGVDLLELRDGLVCAYVGFFDVQGLARQAGVLPDAGSPGEKAVVAIQRLRVGIAGRLNGRREGAR